MYGKFWVVCGAVLAGLAVAGGALGAHALKTRLDAQGLERFEVAVRYQMYHALALVLIGLLMAHNSSRWMTASGVAMLAGIVLFSGGLYAMVFIQPRPFHIIVPFGGFSWIVGWLLLAIAQK